MENLAPDTRTALLRAGLACFAERGFDGTSLRMIADRAQRPLSLLSHHFGNKEGLYLEVFRCLFEHKLHRRGHTALPEGGCTPRDRPEAIRLLREQIHAIFMDVTRDSCNQDGFLEDAAKLWLQEIQCPRPSLVPLLLQHFAPVKETIQKCIQTLRPELGEAEVLFMGSSIIGQAASHGMMRGLNQVIWGQANSPGSPFQASEWLVDLSLHGLIGLPNGNPDL